MDTQMIARIDAATALIAEDDAMHRKFVQMFYNRHWDEKSNFDLVLDTGTMSNDAVASRIVEAVQALEQKPLGTDAVTTALIQVDPVLADAVAKVMAYPLPALPG